MERQWLHMWNPRLTILYLGEVGSPCRVLYVIERIDWIPSERTPSGESTLGRNDHNSYHQSIIIKKNEKRWEKKRAFKVTYYSKLYIVFKSPTLLDSFVYPLLKKQRKLDSSAKKLTLINHSKKYTLDSGLEERYTDGQFHWSFYIKSFWKPFD